ncbi:hypothetical protein ETAA8_26110 [Anatilimnocola aggregata]|uniref:DUF4126 domain-containing protein n=1 Tax=Anatilimnocola aggregata TaxID=2528021 RepID=A0A517YB88_9BACT|nr:DUF4126 domain-containing protein [Anatilimnocola aggregata]QDU27523.1 hypothetical protein ETAA8_26110 [Anatilimnocola aggregata]
MEFALSICLGIGLAAACGFRVFVPMLGLSLAAQADQLQLGAGFEWLDSPVALACFAVATVLEIGAFYIPWLDNLLDTIATPAAVVAGTILTASVVTDMSPLMRWTVAIIAGGGAAGMVQTGTVLLRGTSTATTGGTGNFIISTFELISALVATILAIMLPILAAVLVVAIVGFVFYWLATRQQANATPEKCSPTKQPLA